MLKEHPELKLVIDSHTDNVGKPDANQALSEKGARLQAKGLGPIKPVGSNDTAARQNNRRVQLVKS